MTSRDAFVEPILAFLAGRDLLTLEDIRGALERQIDEAGPDAVLELKERLTEDLGWAYYRPDTLARRIHHLLADRLLHADSVLTGAEHLDAVSGRPVAVFSNHLSYADANLLEILLHRAGHDSLAGRLTAIAGPKVFTSRTRRFSSLCFGTVKVPQSADVSSEEAVLNVREVARAARQSIEVARQRLRAGDALVLYGEGTRSRTLGMQPMLPGVARYLDVPGTCVLPVGMTGTEALFPIGDDTVHPARVVVRIGRPIDAASLCASADHDARLIVDTIGLAVAELLPEVYRGVYGAESERAAARQLLQDVRSES